MSGTDPETDVKLLGELKEPLRSEKDTTRYSGHKGDALPSLQEGACLGRSHVMDDRLRLVAKTATKPPPELTLCLDPQHYAARRWENALKKAVAQSRI
jgi:hypothetical protein